MVVRWVPRLILLALLALGTTTVLAQTHHTRSPYAGQFSPSAPIRALSPEEVRQIAAGEGAGLAKSAELNGVPGPRHVLDMASGLGLTPAQRTRIQAIYEGMHARALATGRQYLRAQEALERDFRAHRLTATTLATRVAEVNRIRGDLETVHLAAHLATAEVLSPDQIVHYNKMRGY
jgi:Spy/CpxP family protein refolding chaperone